MGIIEGAETSREDGSLFSVEGQVWFVLYGPDGYPKTQAVRYISKDGKWIPEYQEYSNAFALGK
jgi:hypothetical protein